MAKKRTKIYDSNLVEALKKLTFPIVDKRHNLTVYLDDERARSNQTRLEHIAKTAHGLSVKDIEGIPEGIIKKSRLKREKKRKNSFNYYFVSKASPGFLVQVSVNVNPEDKRTAKIKTIFLTKGVKKN